MPKLVHDFPSPAQRHDGAVALACPALDSAGLLAAFGVAMFVCGEPTIIGSIGDMLSLFALGYVYAAGWLRSAAPATGLRRARCSASR